MNTQAEEKMEQYYQNCLKNQQEKEQQYQLALCCLHGIGTKQDVEQALEWAKKAASAGYDPADQLIKHPQDAPLPDIVNKDSFTSWCTLAESEVDTQQAMNGVQNLEFKGQQGPSARWLTAHYLAKRFIMGSEADVKRYLDSLLKQEHPDPWGCMLALELGQVPDTEKEEKLEIAAKAGILSAMQKLADCYKEKGQIVKALAWYERAARAGCCFLQDEKNQIAKWLKRYR